MGGDYDNDPYVAFHNALDMPPQMGMGEQIARHKAALKAKGADSLYYRFAAKVWLIDGDGLHVIEPEFFEPRGALDCTSDLRPTNYTHAQKPPSHRVSIYKDRKVRRVSRSEALRIFHVAPDA